MIAKLVLAVPAAALTLLTMATAMLATGHGAEAGGNCTRLPSGHFYCPPPMSTPRPDKPNQKQR